MLSGLVRVWVAAMLMALVSAHPAVRHSAAWALSLVVPFQLKSPWRALERTPSSASQPVRDGLASRPGDPAA